MKKGILKRLLVLALVVAMSVLANSCNKQTDSADTGVDYSKAILGKWSLKRIQVRFTPKDGSAGINDTHTGKAGETIEFKSTGDVIYTVMGDNNIPETYPVKYKLEGNKLYIPASSPATFYQIVKTINAQNLELTKDFDNFDYNRLNPTPSGTTFLGRYEENAQYEK